MIRKSFGKYQSCITPISPRSYITGKVLNPLTGTTFITQESRFCCFNAVANLPIPVYRPLMMRDVYKYKMEE